MFFVRTSQEKFNRKKGASLSRSIASTKDETHWSEVVTDLLKTPKTTSQSLGCKRQRLYLGQTAIKKLSTYGIVFNLAKVCTHVIGKNLTV